jgi:hypothetical protein
MGDEYFVTITAPDRQALLRLGSYELDLLHQTAAATERRVVRLATVKDKSSTTQFEATGRAHNEFELTMDGLLTLEQVGKLVDDGYQVLVRESARSRSQADQHMEFKDWIKAVYGA